MHSKTFRRATTSEVAVAASVVALLALNTACGSGPTEPTPVEIVPMEGLTGFEALLDSIRVELRIPGMAAAIAKDDEIVWSRGFGYADVESRKLATDTTAFYLASVTKPYGAVIVMQLVEEGVLSLDDPVSTYGVELEADGVIRVRHLLNHTSEGVPGSRHHYDGGRYAELGTVIQRASGRTFGDLLVERILKPLGLRHTAPDVQTLDFRWAGLDRDAFMANMASPYELEDGVVVPSFHERHFSPAAGLISSVRDVADFSIALDQNLLLAPETKELMLTPTVLNDGSTCSYALGWYVQHYRGVRLEWHGGEWNAQSALLLRAPEHGLTFVALANTRRMSGAYLMGIGDVMQSGLAQLFVNAYVLGDEPLP
ncbi:MAG: beta-lactamase family protein [Gemmatimonadota bacterium]|nr:MAG: beta-lactamase family protein [Gemmatimonadota bacterium]